MLEVVLLLPNTDRLQQVEDSQNLQLVEGGQYLVEVEQPLI
jgi:hypothetical protein